MAVLPKQENAVAREPEMTEVVLSSSVSRKQRVGQILGPVTAFVVFYLSANALPDVARLAAASGILMAVFWITEAIPLAVTALLPLVLFPVFGIADIQATAAPFAKPVIFLFLGGFAIAAAVKRSGLSRRVALVVVRAFGGTSGQLLAGCMAATAFLSMWISNTAATVMMLPIATRLTRMLRHDSTDSAIVVHRGSIETCMLLGIAYSANIGGLGTLVGTPPNALLAGFLQDRGITLGFGRWMLFAFPLVFMFLGACWFLLYRFALGKRSRGLAVDSAAIDQQYRELGPMTRGEWSVLTVFLATVALWVLREPFGNCGWFVTYCPWVVRLNDTSVAMGATVVLFLLPGNNANGERILDWETVTRLPWGVLILIGGGMSLGSAMSSTGLTEVLGSLLQLMLALHPLLLGLVLTGTVIFLTEIVSNTVITAVTLPVLCGLAAAGSDIPLPLLVSATLAASCAFMLPVGTPPNAVVYGTGRVPMNMMMKYGLCLNLLGAILIPGLIYLFGWMLRA